MVPADLTFAVGNTEQWPFFQRGSGCFADLTTLQNLYKEVLAILCMTQRSRTAYIFAYEDNFGLICV